MSICMLEKVTVNGCHLGVDSPNWTRENRIGTSARHSEQLGGLTL